MANTYTLIASNTLSSSAASVTFSSIPATYTDLVLKMSLRTDEASVADSAIVTFNGTSTTGNSATQLSANVSTVASTRFSGFHQNIPGANNTTSTFNNSEIYIPSYTVSQNKPLSVFNTYTGNSTTSGYMRIFANAGLWSNTASITSIVIVPSGGPNFVSGSTFWLYGLKNS